MVKKQFVVIFALVLFGCEAPLKMDQVNKNKENPLRRTDVYQAAASNHENLVVVGNHGIILRLSKGSESWQRITLPEWNALIDIASCPEKGFYAISYEGYMWKSSDGAKWASTPINNDLRPQAIACDKTGKIWVVGEYSSILVSNDDGSTWDDLSFDDDVFLTSIQFVTQDIGYISGEFGTVLKTIDGGNTWEYKSSLPDEIYPQEMYFMDISRGWITGLAGRVLYTGDGGESWQQQNTRTISPLYSISGFNNSIYIAGGDGVILQKSDSVWKPINSEKNMSTFFSFLINHDNKKLIAGGDSGTIRTVINNN